MTEVVKEMSPTFHTGSENIAAPGNALNAVTLDPGSATCFWAGQTTTAVTTMTLASPSNLHHMARLVVYNCFKWVVSS